MTQPVIMWFRQDLRLADNPALSAAAAGGTVLPVYILDDKTPGDWRWGGASRWWLHHSLAALNTSLPLVLRRGEAVAVLETLITDSGASGLYFTRDYAPWSAALERRVKDLCDSKGVNCHRHGGFLLHEPESIRNGSGEFFKVYTPFSRVCFAKGQPRAPKPVPAISRHIGDVASDHLSAWQLLPTKPNWAEGFAEHWTPGELGARASLQHFLDDGLKGYGAGRDRPDQAHTSRLSPHLHWGEVSTRCGRRRPSGLPQLKDRWMLMVKNSSRKYCGANSLTACCTMSRHFRTSPSSRSSQSFHGRMMQQAWQYGRGVARVIRLSMRACGSSGLPASCTTGCE